MTAPDLHTSATPPGNKSPASAAISPARSREPSPARLLLSPPLLQPKDSRLRPTDDVQTQARQPTSGTGTPNGNMRPRPLSLNEAAHRLARVDSQENGAANGSSGMRWPTSPRLKSPPASANSRRNSSSSTRQSEGESAAEPEPTQQGSRALSVPVDVALKSPVVGPNAASGSKTPRGFSGLTSTLETVQEGDQSSSPSYTEHAMVNSERSKQSEKQPSENGASNNSPERPAKDGDTMETEADAAKNKDALKSPGMGPINGKKTATPMVSAKVRPSTEGSSKNMTVETETVASIPQSAAGATNIERNGNTKRDDSGTLRANPSLETIKAKKERKKNAPKRATAASGQASSKADIFEAKVTSAAEDNESDSDETFIYESNPPEPKSRPHRHHSRTPSVTSTRSLTERKPTNRNLGNIADSQLGVRNKRSMKFASNSYAVDDESGDREYGTVRAHRKKNGSSSAHHHIHGFSHDGHQQGGEEESPFSQASKLRRTRNGDSPQSSSKAHTPKSGSPPPYSQTPTKGDQASSYDFENGHSFSEHDALLGSIRTPRTRPSRSSNLRHIDYLDRDRAGQRGCARRCAGFSVVMMIIVLVLMVAAGFLFATTHPLLDVAVLDIENILATEESLMADLKCTATNPNIVPISIVDMDVNIFAKSTHVSPEYYSHRHASSQHIHHPQQQRRRRHRFPPSDADADLHTRDSVDDGTDPIADPATMLLGRIFHFDSPLAFDASPLRRTPRNATAGLRLEKPGNTTEEDGSERWERIIQFPFDLILRGVLKYTLPLSSRVVTCSVGKSVRVDPLDAVVGDAIGLGSGMGIEMKLEPKEKTRARTKTGAKGEGDPMEMKHTTWPLSVSIPVPRPRSRLWPL